MAWPADDITTGTLVTAAMLNEVADPPACRVFHSVAQSIAEATFVVVAFDSERFDTDAMHDTVTNNSRITFNTAGLYVVSFTGAFDGFADYTAAGGHIRLNGATQIGNTNIGTVGSTTLNPDLNITTLYKFAVGDYVEVRVAHDNAANAARNLLRLGNNSPEFAAVRIGRG